MGDNATTTPATPEAADKSKAPILVPTAVEVGGTTYDLRGLSVEDGAKIYDALPPDYQKMADSYGQFAKDFERVLQINLPPGVTLDSALTELENATRDASGLLTDSAKPYLKQLEAILEKNPTYKAARDTKRMGDNASALVGGTIGGAFDTVMLPLRLLGATWKTTGEIGHAVIPGISDAQAHAFGAAYAAAIFYQGAVRQNMSMIDNPFNNERSVFWSYPVDASLAGMEYAAIHWPFVRDVWPLIAAAFKWAGEALGHIGDKEHPARSFDTILNEVKQEIAAKQASGDTTWRGLTEERLRSQEVKNAKEKMVAAEKVANVPTKARAEAAANGGVIVEQDGKVATVRPTSGGGISTETQQHANGTPINRGDLIGQNFSNLGGETGHHLWDGLTKGEWSWQATGGVVGVGFVGYQAMKHQAELAEGLGKGAKFGKETFVKTIAGTLRGGAAMGTGFVSGLLQGTADIIPGGKSGQVRKIDDDLLKAKANQTRYAGKINTHEAEIQRLEQAVQVTPSTKEEEKQLKKDKSALKREKRQMASDQARLNEANAIIDGPENKLKTEKAEWHKKIDDHKIKITDLKNEIAKPATTLAEKTEQAKAKVRLAIEERALKIDEKALANVEKKLADPLLSKGLQGALDARLAKSADLAAHGNPVQKAAVKAASKISGGAVAVERFGDNVMGGISRFATSKLGVDMAEIGVRAAKVGKVARFAGRAVPVVGVVFTGGAILMTGSAHAETVNGKKLNYFNQLDRDHKLGRINDQEYAAYRALQTAYAASGALGFVSGAAAELGQTGIEQLDPKKMDRYLPASILKEVKGMIDEHQTLKGIHTAAADTHQRTQAAQNAARPLGRGMVARKVAVVALQHPADSASPLPVARPTSRSANHAMPHVNA